MRDPKMVLKIIGLLVVVIALTACHQPSIDRDVTPDPQQTPILVATVPNTSPRPTETLRPSPWQEDLAILQGAMIASRVRTPAEIQAIEAAIRDLAPLLDNTAESTALVAVAGLVAQHGGPELFVDLVSHPTFALLYPLKFGDADDGRYVIDAGQSYRSLLGMRLVRIEGVEESAIIRALETLVPPFDPDFSRALTTELLARPTILASLGIVAPDADATFVFSGANGVERRARLVGTPPSSIVWAGSVEPLVQIEVLPAAAHYAFHVDIAHNSLIFRYARAEALVGLPFEAFLQDMFVRGDALAPVNLVVDLRGNPGGRIDQTEVLLAYLQPRVEAGWIARVDVLVDVETTGAALDCAARLREEAGARVVTDVTSFLALWRRGLRYMQLPNSGLSLVVAGAEASQPSLIDAVMMPAGIRSDGDGYDGLLHALLAEIEGLASAGELDWDPSRVVPGISRPTRADLMRRDLDAVVGLMRSLAEEHGGKFEVVHSADYQGMVQSLASRIPNLEDHKVTLGLMQLLAQAQDAHTRIPVDAWPTFSSLQYPVRVRWFADALYITEVQPGFDALLGSEVVAINTFPPQDLLSALTPLISHETEAGLMAASEPLLINPFVLQALGTTPTLTEVTLDLRALTGMESEEVLPALSETVRISTWHSVRDPSATALWQRQPDTTFYWYTLLDSGRALYFQWNACKEQAGVPYEPFLDAMFDAVARAGAQRIVVDLRRNEGGFSQYLAPFLVRLRQYPQLLEPGHLEVLVGRQTFSTAAYLAGVLHTQYGGRLIGEPMGQVPPFYASIEGLILPSSRLTVHYPTQIWSVGVDQDQDQDQGLDLVTVDLTFSDYLLGRDPVLRRALLGP